MRLHLGILAASAVCSSLAFAGKLDLYGFQPGESEEQAMQTTTVICSPGGPQTTKGMIEPIGQKLCKHRENNGQVDLYFAMDLPGRPLVRVRAIVSGMSDRLQDAVTEQYGVKLKPIGKPGTLTAGTFADTLSNGTTLELQTGMLSLTDYRLMEQAQEATRRKSIQQNPVPKF
ncbi:hypothetical protein HAP47_0005280 [Bradyrhizobium sp. 41S5]|uniref:hypothetical protein n=1 Tax=Bradyrhizobium sp. 41S5 TaxID=1404443 RepID=UPI00156AA041|nr:hypothetical protein [Bradyrhizobium sp. 41S5]UFX46124.1 hypothetical protein HAP47_0005280 [Bradyrhizobium sp. 41S5]